MDMIQQGTMKPVIDKVLPLEQAARRAAPHPGPRDFGKVVVTP